MLELLDLVLELLDVLLLALAECALTTLVPSRCTWRRTYLGSSILSGALACRQLSPALAPLPVVAGVGLAHVVLGAGDGWVDVLLRPASVRLLLLDGRRRTGLSGAGSKEMLS